MHRNTGLPIGQELGMRKRVQHFLQLRARHRAAMRVHERFGPHGRDRGLAFAMGPFVIQMRAIRISSGFPRPQQHRVVLEIQHRRLAHQQFLGLVQVRFDTRVRRHGRKRVQLCNTHPRR
ncbi:unannotated protein [freshwater metagenome]|uniref:Unannotated protein n=1 Tax=freshwater metagenome TaxID=449393 RepID=A0A6J7HUI6_9ZZZZ